MTGEQDLFGMGKGAAQVINTNRSLQTYFTVQQRRAAIEQRENAMLQEMVAGYDPNKQKGLQAKDVADYQSLYSQWKALNLNNRELMKNPAKYPDQYKAAEELKRRMMTVVRLSEQDAQFNDGFSKAYMTNPDKYADGTVEAVFMNRSIPVLQQMKSRGRLLNEQDILLNYKLPDNDAVQKFVKETAEGMPNGATYGREVVKKGGSEGLPLWQNVVQDYTKFTPEAIELAYNTFINYDKNNLKGYNQRFAAMNPAQIEKMQNDVKAATGIDLQIQNGEQLGLADFFVRGGMVRNAPKVEEDKDMLRNIEFQQREKEKEADFRRSVKLDAIRTQNDIRVKQTPGAKEPTADDQLFDFSKGFVNDLNNSNAAAVTEKVRSLFKRNYPPNGAPRVLNPKNMTREQYKAQYKKYLADAYEGTGELFNKNGEPVQRDDAWIDGSYGSGRIVLFLPIQYQKDKDAKPEKKFVIIDPKDPTASQRLFYMLNSGFNFSAKSTPEQLGVGK